ncbi:MAG: hypothetical protein OEV66_11115 [Spirochaetia bacterium]|nr:hypothetical protein [Spirochaetia bacterium]
MMSFSVDNPAAARIFPQSLTFLPEGYSVPQTISVFPQSDCLAAGNRSVTLQTSQITSGDSNYQSSIHPALNISVPVTVVDIPAQFRNFVCSPTTL